ncbi:hypothetical protein OBBRIDRAFT_804921 [Obba rivulosa]|uniref:Uncharacterized protein n=1 Tax=Obba rivulosa TaxID=1052685 RepID=A0A8E2AW29_9APHY|nr:hypothetical protein OBBRIDRAFT_804921 [Obba rivulosa]
MRGYSEQALPYPVSACAAGIVYESAMCRPVMSYGAESQTRTVAQPGGIFCRKSGDLYIEAWERIGRSWASWFFRQKQTAEDTRVPGEHNFFSTATMISALDSPPARRLKTLALQGGSQSPVHEYADSIVLPRDDQVILTCGEELVSECCAEHLKPFKLASTDGLSLPFDPKVAHNRIGRNREDTEAAKDLEATVQDLKVSQQGLQVSRTEGLTRRDVPPPSLAASRRYSQVVRHERWDLRRRDAYWSWVAAQYALHDRRKQQEVFADIQNMDTSSMSN